MAGTERRGEGAVVHVFHATAPTCWWSWGFEGVLNRIPLVYGDKVAVHLLVGSVYDDHQLWKEHLGMDDAEMRAWQDESATLMGVPLAPMPRIDDMPASWLPPSLAVMAASRQSPDQATRYMREALRRVNAEGQYDTTPEFLVAAAASAGLDVARFKKDMDDEQRLLDALSAQGEGFPHVHLGFYDLVVTDAEMTTKVLLDHPFDPARVERAIDYVAGAPLPKRDPGDVVAYLRRHGAAPPGELAKVFAWDPKTADERLGRLAKEGRVREVRLVAGRHWVAV